MTIHSHFSLRGFSNTFVIGSQGEAVVIDPGTFDRQLLLLIEDNHLRIRSVLLTHWHKSHVDGIRTMARIYEFRVYSFYAGTPGCPCIEVRDGSRMAWGGEEAMCIETPGHSEDSVCYKVGDCLFTGDTLMAGEIGSTSSTLEQRGLVNAIWTKILCWGEHSLVFPGHGPPTTVGVEKRFNPHLACSQEPT